MSNNLYHQCYFIIMIYGKGLRKWWTDAFSLYNAQCSMYISIDWLMPSYFVVTVYSKGCAYL